MSQNNQTSAGNFQRVMIVNDTPGEECRIAILDQGRLDGLSAERVATATNVGNIYKGKVTNVEPAIQAAFVDFGEGQNGFLHISDLHPQYFPSGDKTEFAGTWSNYPYFASGTIVITGYDGVWLVKMHDEVAEELGLVDAG